MASLEARAETIKLARLLGQPPENFDYLLEQPAELTRRFREGLSDALFDQHRQGFERLAKLSGLLPTAITATLASTLLGATMSGRVAGELPPERAVKLAKKLPTEFLVRVCVELDPRRAEPLIKQMPADIVIKVANGLIDREDYITMARFVGALPQDVLEQTINAIKSDEVLLRVGFFVENKSQLDEVIRILDEDRLRGAIQAATDHDLWPEALSLVTQITDDLKGQLGDIVADQDESVLDGLADTAQQQQLWSAVLTAVTSMNEDNQRKVVNLPAVTRREVLESIIATAHQQSMWPHLLPLIGLMGAAHQHTVAELALEQDPAMLDSLLDVVRGNESLQAIFLDAFTGLPDKTQTRLGKKAAEHLPKSTYTQLWEIALTAGREQELAALDAAYRASAG